MYSSYDVGARHRFVTHSCFLFFPSVSRSNSRTAWIRNTEFKYIYQIKISNKKSCEIQTCRYMQDWLIHHILFSPCYLWLECSAHSSIKKIHLMRCHCSIFKLHVFSNVWCQKWLLLSLTIISWPVFIIK